MDPVTHTLAGASMARAGLHRVGPLATATLVLGANAPDVDIFVAAAGSYASLAVRRGWTHGPVAMVVLPFVVAGFILGWDRWIRRRRTPDLPPARPPGILLLAFLGVASHVPLDWLNTYGIRLLMPFSGQWFYGDAVFIVDPWLWLILGGGLAVAGRRSLRGHLGWGGLAVLLSVPVLLAPQVPGAARWVWAAGVALIALLRGVRHGEKQRPDDPGARDRNPTADRPALIGTLAGLAYILLMVGASAAAERMGADAARDAGTRDVREILYSPLPGNPFAAGMVIVTGTEYRYGSFRWFPGGEGERITPEPGRVVPRGDWSHPAVVSALQHPDVRHYLVWSRFPWVRVEPVEGGAAVTVGDARYPSGTAGGGLEGVRVVVPEASVDAPEGAASPGEAWRVVDGAAAPWAATPRMPGGGSLRGERIEFAPDRVIAPPPLGCGGAGYQFAVTPAEGLFQGSLPAPAGEAAAAVGIRRLPVLTLQVTCDTGVFDYALVTGDTLLLALDDVIWRLAPEAGAPSPVGAVRRFLGEHLTGEMGFSRGSVERIRTHLTPELVAAIEAYFDHPWTADEVPPIHGDPFTDSQEYPSRFTIGPLRQEGDASAVPVLFRDGTRVRPVEVRLRLVGSRWQVDDLLYEDGATFREVLAPPA